MEYITQDQLKTLLLKCVGSKYPVLIRLKDNQERHVFIKGFADANCSIVTIASTALSAGENLEVDRVKSLHTLKPISLERVKGFHFNVN